MGIASASVCVVSRLITGMTRIALWIVGVANLATPP